MKRALFLLVLIVLIIGSGYYLLCKKVDDVGLGSSSIFSSNKETGILPVSEWQKALIGKWQFEQIEKNSERIFQSKGENFYNANGEFKNFYTLKIYECSGSYIKLEPIVDPTCLRFTTGGSYSGTWKVDTLKQCLIGYVTAINPGTNPIVAFGFEGYKSVEWFSKNDTISCGNEEIENSKYEVKIFTNDRILIVGKDFNDGTESTYEFSRIK
jgi:hypothetical protein